MKCLIVTGFVLLAVISAAEIPRDETNELKEFDLELGSGDDDVKENHHGHGHHHGHFGHHNHHSNDHHQSHDKPEENDHGHHSHHHSHENPEGNDDRLMYRPIFKPFYPLRPIFFHPMHSPSGQESSEDVSSSEESQSSEEFVEEAEE